MIRHVSRRTALAGSLITVGLFGTAALAHHGWSWAQDEQVRMSGTIRDIYLGPPHPTLRVEAKDGLWTVELGNPGRTRSAGFVKGVTKPGANVIVVGHKSSKPNEKRMKAVRIVIDGRNFDFYPERIRGS